MQFISQDEVARRSPYPQLIDALAQGLREPIESPARSHYNPNHDASAVLIMPAWRPGRLMGTKIVSIWPENSALGKPSVSAIYVVNSCQDGTPVAVLDGTELTLRRTAAAAALGAQRLARRDSRQLAILGTGALAAPMALAHASVFDLSEITVWGRSLDKAEAVVATLRAAGLTARASTDLQHTLAHADLVAAATTASTPFIRREWVKAGSHLGLIGAFTASMAEAEPALLPHCRVFVDTREGILQKGGEVLQALRAGLLTPADLRAELAELVSDQPPSGREADHDITVFKSVGFAALDLIAAEHVLGASASASPPAPPGGA